MTTFLNMNVSFPRKSLAAALALLMLCALSKTITIIYRMTWAPAAATLAQGRSPNAAPLQATAAVPTTKTPTLASTNPDDLTGLALNSYMRSYHMVLNGQVVCGAKSCPAQLQVTLSSTRNPEMRQMVETNSDGSYQIAFAFKELPKEQIDWKITAINDEMGTGETHGRQILTDDSIVSLDDSTLEIHS